MLKYIAKTKSTVIVDIVFTTICNASLAVLPLLAMLLFDFDFAGGEGFRFVLIIASVYIACILVNTFTQYIAQKFSWKTTTNFHVALKKSYFEKLRKLASQILTRKISESMFLLSIIMCKR